MTTAVKVPADFCCPKCGRFNVTRYQKRCRYCRTRLAGSGEFFYAEEYGYVWVNDGWQLISEWLKDKFISGGINDHSRSD